MPTFQGQVNEEGVLELVEYVKSLKSSANAATAAPRPNEGNGPAPDETTRSSGTGGRN
jgi:hypothetical protein